jgi:hypothetical protein
MTSVVLGTMRREGEKLSWPDRCVVHCADRPWEMVGMDGFMPKPVKRDALRLTLEQLEQLGSGGIPPPTLPGVDACTLSSALARQLEDARAAGSLVPPFLVSFCPVLDITSIQEGEGASWQIWHGLTDRKE